MEFHQLRYFVAVAELRSFTRAAERCQVAQPSLSQQIIKLERELGQPLFERLGRTVRLTEAGQVLYDQATGILDSVDEIQERIVSAVAPHRGTVHVGAIPTVAPYLLPTVLRTFSRKFPEAQVSLHEDLTEATIRRCLEGVLDVGVIASVPDHRQLTCEPLMTEELLLALPRNHHLLKQRRISLQDAVQEPFILMNETHCLGEQILNFCRSQQSLPVVRCWSVQLLTVQELVAQGHGVSLIPAMAREFDRGRRCQYRSLTPDSPTRTISLIWHENRYQSPVVRSFLQVLREVHGHATPSAR